MANILQTKHYELPSTELARWLEAQGGWWNVDGDPLLTGRLPFPCPADELAAELRRLNRLLLVQAIHSEFAPEGQGRLTADDLGKVAVRYSGSQSGPDLPSEFVNDRQLYLCWKGSPHEWLLIEDSATAKQFQDEVATKPR
jgi:hypothetical protein